MKRLLQLTILLQITLLFSGVDNFVNDIRAKLDQNDFQSAKALFNDAILEFDSSAELFFMGGQIGLRLDDLEKANEYFQKAIELDDSNQGYRDEWGKLNEMNSGLKNAKKTFDNGNVDDAIIEYLKLGEMYPQNGIVFYTLGLVFKSIEDYDLAVENYLKAITANPFEEKYAKAISVISQVMAKQGDTEYRRKEYEEAIEYYLKAVKYSPDYTLALFKIARTYYKMGDLENCQKYLQQNIAVDSEQEQSHKMLGDLMRKKGDIEKAIHHYKTAIEINSKYSKAFYSLGTILMSEARNLEAREALSTAVLMDPTYAKAFGTLGVLEQNFGNNSIAIHNYIKATENDAKSYDIFYRLASVLNIEKKYEDAKKAAKDCLNIKRNYAPAHFELGVAEKALGNRIAAKTSFEKAQKDKNWRKSAQFELDLLQKGL